MERSTASLRALLEAHQVSIYFVAVAAAALAGVLMPAFGALEGAINPALAVMLFATFLQVPLGELGRSFRQIRLMAALLVVNFAVIPVLVALLVQLLPPDPLLRFGVLLVLLSPCIDYVVTFAHLGRADARGLLAATPLLLGAQMLLLPAYLAIIPGGGGGDIIRLAPFLHAFVWLIAVPLLLAGLVQRFGRNKSGGERALDVLGLLPVPATALVLFIVVCAVVPQLGAAGASALAAAPVYVLFALAAPVAGLLVGRLFRLPPGGVRAVAFSAATRNSLVVLPLGLAVPGAVPVVPAIIVTQTLIELLSELMYIRAIPLAAPERHAGRTPAA